MKTEISNKQLQHINTNNTLTRGRTMKYFSIILTVMVTALMGRAIEPVTGWSYDQSTQQAFYIFDAITVDGVAVEGNGCGDTCSDGSYNECYVEGGCDVVGAFRRGVCDDPQYQNSQQLCEILSVWNTDEEFCIGWRYADASGATTVALMGMEGECILADLNGIDENGDEDFVDDCTGEYVNTYYYAQSSDDIYLKIYDSDNQSYLDITPSSPLPDWALNGIYN